MNSKLIGGTKSVLHHILRLLYPDCEIKILNSKKLSFSLIVQVEIVCKGNHSKQLYKLKDYRYREFYDFISYSEINDYVAGYCCNNSFEIETTNEILNNIDDITISIHGKVKYRRVIDKNGKTISMLPSFINGKSKFTKKACEMIAEMANTFANIKAVQNTLNLEHCINITIPGIKKILHSAK